MQVVIGRIGRAHGIRGELNVDIRTDEPERRFAPGSSVVCGKRTLTVKQARHHGGRLVVSFAEIPDRNAAEALHGIVLEAEIDPSDMPEDPDEFYDHQLVGLEVRSNDVVVGTVTGLVHLPHQDTLLVDIDGREVFVPFVSELVPVVDVAGGFVTVADVAGLLDPAAAENAASDLPESSTCASTSSRSSRPISTPCSCLSPARPSRPASWRSRRTTCASSPVTSTAAPTTPLTAEVRAWS